MKRFISDNWWRIIKRGSETRMLPCKLGARPCNCSYTCGDDRDVSVPIWLRTSKGHHHKLTEARPKMDVPWTPSTGC